METKVFTRVGSAPHLPLLATALQPILTVANAGSFHITTTPGFVSIEQGGWSSVDLAAVQVEIDAAPDDTPQLRAQGQLTEVPRWEKAAFMALLDIINVERARHSAVAITPAQFITAAKARVA